MEQYSVSQSRPVYFKAVIPVLAWIAAGLLSLYDIFRVFQTPIASYAAIDLFWGLFFPPMVVPAVLLAIYFTLYRRKGGGNVLLAIALGMFALSIFGGIMEVLLFGSLYIMLEPFECVLTVMLILAFVSACRRRPGKIFLILSACAGILCTLLASVYLFSVYHIYDILGFPFSLITFLCHHLGSITLYLSLLLYGIHLSGAPRKENTIQSPAV